MSEKKHQTERVGINKVGYVDSLRAESSERQHKNNDEWPRFLSHSSPVKGYRRFSHQDSTDSFGSAEHHEVSFVCVIYILN